MLIIPFYYITFNTWAEKHVLFDEKKKNCMSQTIINMIAMSKSRLIEQKKQKKVKKVLDKSIGDVVE